MAEIENPIVDRVKKMAAILAAAKLAGEKVQEEKEAKEKAETE